MPEFLDLLAEQLEQDGIATGGQDLFISDYPEGAPDACTVIRLSGGTDEKDLPIQYQVIQIMTRDPGFQVAYERAFVIYRYLFGDTQAGKWLPRHNFKIGVTREAYVLTCSALQLPSDIGKDEAGRSEVSFNIRFVVRLS